MSTAFVILLIAGLGTIAWASARAKALAFGSVGRVHSRPGQHATHAALWAVVPALAFLALWSGLTPRIATQRVIDSPAAAALPASPFERETILSEARAVAAGRLKGGFQPLSDTLAPVFAQEQARLALLGLVVAVGLAVLGGVYGWLRVRRGFRARLSNERFVMLLLVLASSVAILTTFGIVASLLFESARFFGLVAPLDFLTGTRWSPQAAGAGDMSALGAVPLFWGTLFIGATIAMAVAIPFGLLSAIYLTQYASPGLRRVLKPLLEILAGVPTVVYGYFAALTVAPAVRSLGDALGVSGASSESALAAGLVMGIMIIPFVSSMADDSLTAVPAAMRDASYALGATPAETIRRVLVPAALPGIVGGVLLAVSRAIGETMIVVMAAGLAANLTANPFASVTTVTVQIVQLLTGDQEFDSAKTLAAFALGLVLFVVTLILNIVALAAVRRYREAYE